jgi:hypothetical protein
MVANMVIGSVSVSTRALLHAAWLGATPVVQTAPPDSATVCLVDAATHAPVIGVELRIEPLPARAGDRRPRAA